MNLRGLTEARPDKEGFTVGSPIVDPGGTRILILMHALDDTRGDFGNALGDPISFLQTIRLRTDGLEEKQDEGE